MAKANCNMMRTLLLLWTVLLVSSLAENTLPAALSDMSTIGLAQSSVLMFMGGAFVVGALFSCIFLSLWRSRYKYSASLIQNVDTQVITKVH